MELCIEREAASPWSVTRSERAWLDEGASPEIQAFEAQADLGTWVFPGTVLTWAVHEAEMLEWNSGESASSLNQSPGYRSKLMVALLAFAYARQIFDSESIALACRTDPMLRRVCSRSAPFAGEFRSFRRRHRPVLEKVLTRVFMRAIRHRFDPGAASLPGELEEDLRQLAVERLDIARHMDAG